MGAGARSVISMGIRLVDEVGPKRVRTSVRPPTRRGSFACLSGSVRDSLANLVTTWTVAKPLRVRVDLGSAGGGDGDGAQEPIDAVVVVGADRAGAFQPAGEESRMASGLPLSSEAEVKTRALWTVAMRGSAKAVKT